MLDLGSVRRATDRPAASGPPRIRAAKCHPGGPGPSMASEVFALGARWPCCSRTSSASAGTCSPADPACVPVLRGEPDLVALLTAATHPDPAHRHRQRRRAPPGACGAGALGPGRTDPGARPASGGGGRRGAGRGREDGPTPRGVAGRPSACDVRGAAIAMMAMARRVPMPGGRAGRSRNAEPGGRAHEAQRPALGSRRQAFHHAAAVRGEAPPTADGACPTADRRTRRSATSRADPGRRRGHGRPRPAAASRRGRRRARPLGRGRRRDVRSRSSATASRPPDAGRGEPRGRRCRRRCRAADRRGPGDAADRLPGRVLERHRAVDVVGGPPRGDRRRPPPPPPHPPGPRNRSPRRASGDRADTGSAASSTRWRPRPRRRRPPRPRPGRGGGDRPACTSSQR